MFNFTTTNVINHETDLVSGKNIWNHITTSDGSSAFQVLRVNTFIADNITYVYKADPVDPEKAKICIDMSSVTRADGSDPEKNDIFRLNLYIGLTQASQDSRYANDLIYKGKPISIEFVWTGDAETTASKLAKDMVRCGVVVYNEKILKVESDGTYITVEAITEYQRFKGVAIEQFLPLANHGMGEYFPVITLDDFEEKDSNDEVEGANCYFKGKEGFGTFSYIMHNLRLPTIKRTRAFAPNQDENPVPGAKYTQYTIHYCVKRGELGMNAVGDMTISHTTHVFYVKDDLVDSFESTLTESIDGSGVEITSVPE